MILLILLLILICVLQFFYIRHIKQQLSLWLDSLKAIKDSPHQKIFTKDKNFLSEISFELNHILEENQKQLLQLKQTEDINKQILTSLSHDVRTPLTSLIGYLEALPNNNNMEEKKEYLSIAYQKALNLKDLTNMLFEWFKINSKEQQYQKKAYDINELTREIVIEWLPLFEEKQIVFTPILSDEEWFVWIDKIAYQRIINNLIQNAIQHGKCSHITIQIQKDKDALLITVSNNGIVIPPEKLPYLFNRLYKCDSARSQNGNGLGLAITKELVTAMSGEISVTSSLKKQTTFSILFPLCVM